MPTCLPPQLPLAALCGRRSQSLSCLEDPPEADLSHAPHSKGLIGEVTRNPAHGGRVGRGDEMENSPNTEQ